MEAGPLSQWLLSALAGAGLRAICVETITGSFGIGLGYTADPRHWRRSVFTFGLAVASLAPLIIGWIATAYSVAAGLPLLALSFLLLAPLFIWFAPDMTRKELTDFVGQKVG